MKPIWFYVVAAFGMWRQLGVRNRSDILIKIGVSSDKMNRRRQLNSATLFIWSPILSRKTSFAYRREEQWRRTLKQWCFRTSGTGEYFLVPEWLPEALKVVDRALTDAEIDSVTPAALQLAATKIRNHIEAERRAAIAAMPDFSDYSALRAPPFAL